MFLEAHRGHQYTYIIHFNIIHIKPHIKSHMSHKFNIHQHSPGEFLCDLDLSGSWISKIFHLGIGLCPIGWLGLCSRLVEVFGRQSESFWADTSAASSVYCHLGRTFDAVRLGGGLFFFCSESSSEEMGKASGYKKLGPKTHKPFRKVNVTSTDWYSRYRYM